MRNSVQEIQNLAGVLSGRRTSARQAQKPLAHADPRCRIVRERSQRLRQAAHIAGVNQQPRAPFVD